MQENCFAKLMEKWAKPHAYARQLLNCLKKIGTLLLFSPWGCDKLKAAPTELMGFLLVMLQTVYPYWTAFFSRAWLDVCFFASWQLGSNQTEGLHEHMVFAFSGFSFRLMSNSGLMKYCFQFKILPTILLC